MPPMGNQVDTEDEEHLREQQRVMTEIKAQRAQLAAVKIAENPSPSKTAPKWKIPAEAKKEAPVEIDAETEAEMLREQEQMVALLAKERERRAKSKAADQAFSHLLAQPLIQLLEDENPQPSAPRPPAPVHSDSFQSSGRSAMERSSSAMDRSFSAARAQQFPDETWGDKAPAGLVCPLTLEMMVDPVSTCDGQSYERKQMEEWLRHNDTSPLTNKRLENKTLTPNIALRRTIEEWNATRAQRLLAKTKSEQSPANEVAKECSISAVPRGAMEISIFSPVKTFSDHESARNSLPQNTSPVAAAGAEEWPSDSVGFA